MAQFFAGLAGLSSSSELPVRVAAVCYRLSGSSVKFLLVNTSSGKWTFPKGRLNPGMSPSESASCEAWEEAGAKGRIEEKAFASYLDTKRTLGHDSLTREMLIAAYLFKVHATVVPKESGRNPNWFSSQEAKRQLTVGRSVAYAEQIINIIDAAVEELAEATESGLSCPCAHKHAGASQPPLQALNITIRSANR
jgi:8-oxo-dGTP pyrophosphatase MutT (NUDIX family)